MSRVQPSRVIHSVDGRSARLQQIDATIYINAINDRWVSSVARVWLRNANTDPARWPTMLF